MNRLCIVLLTGFVTACGGGPSGERGRPQPSETSLAITPFAAQPDERHLRDLRMLTHKGENAEGYFSPDGQKLIFQATRPGESACDQIYILELATAELQRVSTGQGRTTCSFFFPSGQRILYSSTHLTSPECPPRPDYSRGYVWALYDYDIFTARPDGTDLHRLTGTPGYDAEGTVSSDGKTIVFTSVRDGDLEIYTMDADGKNARRLTHEEGYDGGGFFSPDGTRIVYRAHHPTDPQELSGYRRLLKEGLVRPTYLEIMVMEADGSNKRQLTNNGAANFAPYFHPDGERIIFSSNLHDPRSRNFDLYLISPDGTGLERVTTHPEFDGFPMFSPDGTKLVFASNRGAAQPGETNLFLADWVEHPPTITAPRPPGRYGLKPVPGIGKSSKFLPSRNPSHPPETPEVRHASRISP